MVEIPDGTFSMENCQWPSTSSAIKRLDDDDIRTSQRWVQKSGFENHQLREVGSFSYLFNRVFSTIPSVVGLFRISETVKSKKMEGTDPTFAFRSWEGCNIFSVGQKVVRNETTTL